MTGKDREKEDKRERGRRRRKMERENEKGTQERWKKEVITSRKQR